MPEIKITAEADVKGGIDGLKQLRAELGKTAITAVKTDSAIDKAGKTLGTSLKTGANQATGALTNLGRVIQDAPFGIIGITNNINPLLESFQRLKAETGTTGGALKALAGSLIGGGGLGLAVSVVTSLLTVFAMNTRSTGDAAEDAGKKVKTYADFLHEAATSVAQEQTDVLGLIGVLKNETETRERKLAAIKELQKIQPEIFAGLKLEKDAVIGLDAAYTAYVANLKNVIQAKILQAQLEPLLTRQMELQKIILNAQSTGTKNLADEARNAARGEAELTNQLAKQQKVLQGLTLIGANVELTPLNAQIDDITKQLFALSKTVKLPIKEVKVKPEKITIDTEHFSELHDVNKVSIPPLTFAPKVIVTPKIAGFEISDEEQKRILAGLQALFDAAALAKFQETAVAAINQTMNNIATESVTSFAEALGTAVGQGEGGFDNLFDNLMKSVGQQVTDLGKFLVKIGVEMLIAKKALKALSITPQGAIIAGVALVALGAVLKASAQKKYPGFATGVRGFEGGTAIVGERGPERIFLPAGSSVQPNNELNAFGGGGQVFIPAVTLSGSDLVIAFNRASQQMNRNN